MAPKLLLVLALAIVAGVIGWRVPRKRRRSLYDEKPLGMSDAAYKRREQRRELIRRCAAALIYGGLGGLIGWAVGLLLRLS